MEAYKILPHTFQQAEKLGLHIRPSKYHKYKIDIYDMDRNFLFSGGDRNYMDYAYYLKLYDKEYADERKKLYAIRHQKESIRGKIISFLLWQ